TAKLFKKANAAEARSHLVLRVVPRRICHSNSGTTGAGASPHGPACDLQLRLCEVVGGGSRGARNFAASNRLVHLLTFAVWFLALFLPMAHVQPSSRWRAIGLGRFARGRMGDRREQSFYNSTISCRHNFCRLLW